MGYNPTPTNFPVFAADTMSVDAFSRLRVSSTDQRLDVEFLYDKQEMYFDEVTNLGSVTHDANARDLRLAITATGTSDMAMMSSYPIPYTPGNSQLIEVTGALDLAAVGGGNAEVFLRSSVTGSVTEEVIPQSSWIAATTGVDWTKTQIFMLDFQSLKIGRIRFALNQGGNPVPVAEITNDNERNTGYWQTPDLPVYWKLYNDATYTYMECGYGNAYNAIGFRYKVAKTVAATMSAVCCTAKSEGGGDLKDMDGLPRVADMGVASKVVTDTEIPLLSIRPTALFNDLDNLVLSIPKALSVVASESIRLSVVHNGTLTGAAWAAVGATSSVMEVDTTATAVSGGHEILVEYISASDKASTSLKSLLGKTVMWNRLSSETGILTLVAIRTSGTSSSVLASIQWDEIR